MRKVVLAAVLVLMASGAQAVTLNVVGGQLMGASGVLVDGSLYDVQFLDGTCADFYSGCDEASDFTFQTEASALLASQALLDQVLIDGPLGSFDDDVASTNGLENMTWGQVHTPFAVGQAPQVSHCMAGGCFSNSSANNYSDQTLFDTGRADDFAVSLQSYVNPSGQDWGSNAYVTLAVWSPVPEPSTALLMGLGLTGLSWSGRRRNRS